MYRTQQAKLVASVERDHKMRMERKFRKVKELEQKNLTRSRKPICRKMNEKAMQARSRGVFGTAKGEAPAKQPALSGMRPSTASSVPFNILSPGHHRGRGGKDNGTWDRVVALSPGGGPTRSSVGYNIVSNAPPIQQAHIPIGNFIDGDRDTGAS